MADSCRGEGGGADVGVRESKPVMECHVSAASAAYASPPGCHDNQRILTCHFQSPPFLALPLLLTLTKRIINLLFVPDTKLFRDGVCWSLLESFLSAFCFLLCLFISTSHNRKHTPHIHSKCLLALFQLGRNESEESRKDTGSGVLKERDYNAESVNNPAPKLAFLLCKPVSVCVCL